ncbi:MAG: hypothetical protein AB2421_14815 [Thermotaleaceae bacterium]|jgi:hypothetical protein
MGNGWLKLGAFSLVGLIASFLILGFISNSKTNSMNMQGTMLVPNTGMNSMNGMTNMYDMQGTISLPNNGTNMNTINGQFISPLYGTNIQNQLSQMQLQLNQIQLQLQQLNIQK